MEASVPNDIIRHIFLQLSMKSVIRCQCVCKQWCSLIQDSNFKLSYRGQQRVIILSLEFKPQLQDYDWDSRFFVRSTSLNDLRLQRPFGEAAYPLIHASHQYLVRALCSFNGVVLLVGDERDIWLWNPTTRCSTKVLKLPYQEMLNPVILAAGLCYDSCTRDYKVVLLLRRLLRLGHGFGDPFVISASLNHKEWRPVEFPYNSARGGVEFRNTFHWWASDIKDLDRDRDMSGGNRILYFDLVRDEFRIVPIPERRENNSSIVGLGVIDDCLCMTYIIQEQEGELKTKTMQVLIMKEYGKQESWMIAFSIQMPELGDVYGSYGLTFYSQKKNAREVLFLLRNAGWCGRQVYVYDRKKDEMKEELMDFLQGSSCRYFVSMCLYVESFVCLPLQSQN
nr:F-box/kelch-repeat protein At3g23880-like [Ipomoea batatas]